MLSKASQVYIQSVQTTAQWAIKRYDISVPQEQPDYFSKNKKKETIVIIRDTCTPQGRIPKYIRNRRLSLSPTGSRFTARKPGAFGRLGTAHHRPWQSSLLQMTQSQSSCNDVPDGL